MRKEFNEYFINFRFEVISFSHVVFSDNTLCYFKKSMKIDLSFSKQITDKGLGYLENVRVIILRGCQITDGGLKYLKRVHTIDLSYCRQITDEGLKYLEGTYYLFNRMRTNNRSRIKIFKRSTYY